MHGNMNVMKWIDVDEIQNSLCLDTEVRITKVGFPREWLLSITVFWGATSRNLEVVTSEVLYSILQDRTFDTYVQEYTASHWQL
jgi:hypothetical protein